MGVGLRTGHDDVQDELQVSKPVRRILQQQHRGERVFRRARISRCQLSDRVALSAFASQMLPQSESRSGSGSASGSGSVGAPAC